MFSRVSNKGNLRMDHEPSAIESWVTRTRLYQAGCEMRREIMLHKWYESERAGRDIGWERAAVDWMIRHGQRMRSSPESAS